MVDYFCSYVVTVLRPQISSPKQRGLVGGQRGGRGQKTVVGLVAAVPLSPRSGSSQGLRCGCGSFLFSWWPACLSP